KTNQGRICCSTILKRACSTSGKAVTFIVVQSKSSGLIVAFLGGFMPAFARLVNRGKSGAQGHYPGQREGYLLLLWHRSDIVLLAWRLWEHRDNGLVRPLTPQTRCTPFHGCYGYEFVVLVVQLGDRHREAGQSYCFLEGVHLLAAPSAHRYRGVSVAVFRRFCAFLLAYQRAVLLAIRPLPVNWG